jgi:hypothetical protein
MSDQMTYERIDEIHERLEIIDPQILSLRKKYHTSNYDQDVIQELTVLENESTNLVEEWMLISRYLRKHR